MWYLVWDTYEEKRRRISIKEKIIRKKMIIIFLPFFFFSQCLLQGNTFLHKLLNIDKRKNNIKIDDNCNDDDDDSHYNWTLKCTEMKSNQIVELECILNNMQTG